MGHANDINRHGVYNAVKHNRKDLASKVQEYLNDVQMMQAQQKLKAEDEMNQTPDGRSEHSYYLRKMDDNIERRVSKAKTMMAKYPQNSAEPHKRRLFADSAKKKGVKAALKYSSLPRINEQTLDTFNNDVYFINKENGIRK